jgi:cyclin D1/2/4, plant
VFEAKTIQRMELLVLSTLRWRMQAVTPFSYLDYFLRKLNSGGDEAPRGWLSRSAELILCAARGMRCKLDLQSPPLTPCLPFVSVDES